MLPIIHIFQQPNHFVAFPLTLYAADYTPAKPARSHFPNAIYSHARFVHITAVTQFVHNLPKTEKPLLEK